VLLWPATLFSPLDPLLLGAAGARNDQDDPDPDSGTLIGFARPGTGPPVDAGLSPLSSNAPNDSSSPNRSTAPPFCALSKIGKSRAWGRGDGGAGHRPGRAAARSMRLSVRWCCVFFSSGDRMGTAAGAFGGSTLSVGREDLDGGRGGEGVPTPGDDGEDDVRSSKSNPKPSVDGF
jgi:hypothetical protein